MRILFIGHFGGKNIGDELILLSQMQLFRNKYKYKDIEFIVYSYDKNFTQKMYERYDFNIKTILAFGLRTAPVSIYEQLKFINDIDFAIVGGGGLIQDIYSSYGIFQYLLPAYICFLRAIPVYTFSVGVYRFNYLINKLLFKEFLFLVNGISVRDNISVENIKQINQKILIEKVPDSVLVLDIQEYINSKNENNIGQVTIVVREFFEPYIDSIKKIAISLNNIVKIEKINLVVFENSPIEHLLVSKLKEVLSCQFNNIQIIDKNDPIEYLNTLQQSNIVIAGRLHGILPSIILQKRLICLSYAPKIESYCKQNGYKFLTFQNLKKIQDINIEQYIVDKKINQHENEKNKRKIQSYVEYIDVSKNNKPTFSLLNKISIILELICVGALLLGIHVFNKIIAKKTTSEMEV